MHTISICLCVHIMSFISLFYLHKYCWADPEEITEVNISSVLFILHSHDDHTGHEVDN